jgi:hypothetical protein
MSDSPEDIRDIRGPKSATPWPWVITAAVAGALLVMLCAVYIIRGRRRGAHGPAPSLTEQTLDRLEGAKTLMRPETAREFGIATSEVIREYIERRFEVRATQRTTEEFLQGLLGSANDSLARHRALLADFLHQCDFVKFAGGSLSPEDLQSLLSSARSFVLETGEPAAA